MNDINGTKAVRALLGKHGVKPLKSMGQNFLVDGSIPNRIASLSGIDKTCGVLEVGPGIGALTAELSRVAGYVTAVEVDRRLLPALCDTLDGAPNVDIVSGDILKLDIVKLINEKMPGFRPCVCANLPYNITSPALIAFINAGIFETITVMVQREVARRICALPGSPDYSAFSVYVRFHTEPEALFDVPPESFTPRPRVWSSVVTMRRREDSFIEDDSETAFFSVVRAAFALRRKTLINALYAAFGNEMSKDKVAQVVTQCGFDPLTRGETLGIEDFAQLALQITKSKLT